MQLGKVINKKVLEILLENESRQTGAIEVINHNTTKTATAICGIEKALDNLYKNERLFIRLIYIMVLGVFALIGVKLWGLI